MVWSMEGSYKARKKRQQAERSNYIGLLTETLHKHHTNASSIIHLLYIYDVAFLHKHLLVLCSKPATHLHEPVEP